MKQTRSSAQRICALLALLLTAAFLLSSCGVIIINDGSETTVPDDTTAHDTTAEPIDHSPTLEYLELANEYLSALPAMNLNGEELLISGIGAEKLGGAGGNTVVGLNRGKRNNAVASACNAALTYVELADDVLYDELLAAIQAGEFYTDLIVLPQQDLAKFVMGGLLYDVSQLNCGFAEQPYFDYSAIQSTGGGGKLYGVIGDASYDPDYTYATYFNRTLVSSAGLDDPYALVSAGQWTLDKFTEYMAAVSGANLGIENLALHGSASDAYADALYFAGGGSLMQSVFGAAPAVAVPTEQNESLLSRIGGLFNDNSMWDGDDSTTRFTEGGMLFYTDLLLSSEQLSVSAADWGVLPLPKADAAQQSYRCLTDGQMPVIAVPANVSEPDVTSYLISALFASSYRFLRSSYAENQMAYFLRNSASIDMVYTVVNSPVYDAAYIYGKELDAVARGSYTALRTAAEKQTTLTAAYDRTAAAAEKALEFLAPPAAE